MKTKTIGRVAAELLVLYFQTPDVQKRVDLSEDPFKELADVGREQGLHDMPNTGGDGDKVLLLEVLLERLLLAQTTCNGKM